VNTQYNRYRSEISGFDAEALPLPYALDEKEIQSIWPDREGEIDRGKWPMFKSNAAPLQMAEQNGSGLGKKIKEALQTDYDPEESLAAIRAILVGPTRRLHDARIEEIVTILEESDRASQIAIRNLENRCDTLSAKLDTELRKVNDKLEEANQTESTMDKLSRDFNVRLKEQDEKIANNFETLTKQFEERFLGQDEHSEKIQMRSAEVFVQGLSDIAKRLTALRRSYMG
jgi:hypothetical protein